MTTGLDDVHCARCGATRFWHEGELTYCDGFVVPTWGYSEPTRIDDIDALLTRVAEELDMAKDPISPDEAREIAEAERKKAQDLFDSLQREIESKRKK